MSPSSTSNDDFPRLTGPENFDVWKMQVQAALDGKHLLGFITKQDYDGISDSDSDSSDEGYLSDADESKSSSAAEEATSDAVDYDEDDEELRPNSEDEDGDAIMRASLPAVKPFNHKSNARKRRKEKKSKRRALSSSKLRRLEAETKAFLLKTIDNTHMRTYINLKSSYEIFQAICKKYEGSEVHGDPYFIQHYLMEIRYEEGSDLTTFFIALERAIKAASEATESPMTDVQKSLYLFHSMQTSWKDLRVWKGTRKYIPFEELKMSIEAKVREKQAQERYRLARGTPESDLTRNEKALTAAVEETALPATANTDTGCAHCGRRSHAKIECRKLQKEIRDGTVKEGTVLPAGFQFRAATPQTHPYDRNQRYESNRHSGQRFRNNNYRGRGRGYFNSQRGRGNRHQGRGDYYQSRHEHQDHARIAIMATSKPALSLTATANPSSDPISTIDSGCTRHVTYQREWFSAMTPSVSSVTVGGKNEIPITATGQVTLEVIDSKGKTKILNLSDVLYAPDLKFNLFSVPAAVKQDFHFTFNRKTCAVHTDQRFNIKANMAQHVDLYQFTASPMKKSEAHIAAPESP